MLSAILIILIALLVFLSAFLSNNSTLFDRRRKWYNVITKIGWWILGINLCIILLSLSQYYLSQQESDKRDKDLRKTYTQSVETITRKQDSNSTNLTISLKKSYDTSTTNIVDALARYGLKYDSAKNTIEKMVKNVAQPIPVLQLAPENEILQLDSALGTYRLTFVSSDAGSTNYKIKVYNVIELESGKLIYVGKNDQIIGDEKLSTNMAISSDFTLKGGSFKYLYILVKGTYSNLDNTKIIPINTIYRYSTATKATYIIKGNYNVRIKAFFDTSLTQKK